MKRWFLILRLFMMRSGIKRARYFHTHNIFYRFGKDCYFHPSIIPTEPYLVSIGNNVSIASGVKFITHDVIGFMMDNSKINENDKYGLYLGKIEIGDNVAIGQDTHILYDVKIGSNVVIGAGSLVNKDIPDNCVAGGVPCKVLGTFDEFINKRNGYKGPRNKEDINMLINYFWGEEVR